MTLAPAVLAQAALAQAVPAQELAKPIAEWVRTIEERGVAVEFVRVERDPDGTMVLPPVRFPHVLRRYFSQGAFLVQLDASHALTVNYSGPEGRVAYVLLNMARAADWEGAADAVLGHELAHIWLSLEGYAAPAYEGDAACLAAQGGDIVQHVLLREELANRGIDYLGYWVRNLAKALENARTIAAGPVETCRRAQSVTLLTDVHLALTGQPERWPERAVFLQRWAALDPAVATLAESLAGHLREHPPRGTDAYQAALEHVLGALRNLAAASPSSLP